jgi:hypothetical protein
MVRMGSPVRFRRGAPPQTSRPGRVQHPASSVPRGLRIAVCQRFASGSPTVVVRARSEATVLSDLRCCRLRWPCAVGTSSLLDLHIHENERTRGALLSSDDYGSSVERAVKRQVLWRVADASAERRSSVVNFGVAQAMAAGRSTVQVAERRSDETLAHAVDGAGALLPETMAGTTRATHSPAQTAEEILRHAKRQRTSDAGH